MISQPALEWSGHLCMRNILTTQVLDDLLAKLSISKSQVRTPHQDDLALLRPDSHYSNRKGNESEADY